MSPFLSKFVRYSAAAIPGFLLSIALNILLVEVLNTPKPLAYALVLWAQITYGFFANRLWVFRAARPERTGPSLPFRRQYIHWVSGISLFRAADWAVYTLMVAVIGINYIAAQIVDSLLFTFLKFAFARRLFEGRNAPGPE